MSWKNPFRRLFRASRELREGSSPEENSYAVLSNPYVAGKLLPSNPVGRYHLVLKPRNRPSDTAATGDLPVPPREMWEGYGLNETEYLDSGRRHMATMQELLQKAGLQTPQRVLDLGCAAGRMIRFFPREKDRPAIWGADINAKYIEWCQQQLSPPFLFTTITTLPHLPFEDNYFDVVYCGSVFTHITDLADAWFLEVQRVLGRRGFAYITIHDKGSLQTLLARSSGSIDQLAPSDVSWEKPCGEPGTSSAGAYWINEFNKTVDLDTLDYASFSFSQDPYSNIFYDRDYLVDKWSRFSEIVSVNPRAYGGQTALLFRKR